jgi:hypothetical protein
VAPEGERRVTKRRPMTEAEWLAAESALDLLHYLQQHRRVGRVPGGRRRLLLFRCACCRSVWNLFEDEHCRRAVEVAERFADGTARKPELEAARAKAQVLERETQEYLQAYRGHAARPDAWLANRRHSVAMAAQWTTWTQYTIARADIVAMSLEAARASGADLQHGSPKWVALRESQARIHAALVRDIFGNPFRPASCGPSWLTHGGGVVPKLAKAIYEERAFDRLPVLADALEDAGGADAAILAHCRGPGPHARGCWAVDLLLGKG